MPIRASSSQEEKKALISDGGGRMDGKEGGWLADGRLCQCRTRGEALLTAIKAAVGLGGRDRERGTHEGKSWAARARRLRGMNKKWPRRKKGMNMDMGA